MTGISFRFKDGTKVEFGVSKFPHRKQFALYKMRGANVDILGYFTSEENAERFCLLLDIIIEETNKQ
jgi:hypothetical protein